MTELFFLNNFWMKCGSNNPGFVQPLMACRYVQKNLLLATNQRISIFHIFCYLGKFGQANLWTSWPNWATKKKENYQPEHCNNQHHINHSYSHFYFMQLKTDQDPFTLQGTFKFEKKKEIKFKFKKENNIYL